MIPDYQTLMKPVLASALQGERRIGDVVEEMADLFGLTPEERLERIPSGQQQTIANRVHWARTYLKQAGLVHNTRRAHFVITDAGRRLLEQNPERITAKDLKAYTPFVEFQNRSHASDDTDEVQNSAHVEDKTPDEVMQAAYQKIRTQIVSDLLDRLRAAPPAFFERLIVDLLVAMGYGTGKGQVLGGTGDDGVDGVINQDPLGVDQVYIQAKRYQEGSNIGSGAIRDFYGALGMKDVTKGIFVTTSGFSASARETADKLGARIVLIDGRHLADLMLDHQIGARVDQVFRTYTVDEGFFE